MRARPDHGRGRSGPIESVVGVLSRSLEGAGANPARTSGELGGLRATDDVRSVRVGRSHRLLFRPAFETGELVVLEVIHRRDLERTVRRYA